MYFLEPTFQKDKDFFGWLYFKCYCDAGSIRNGIYMLCPLVRHVIRIASNDFVD